MSVILFVISYWWLGLGLGLLLLCAYQIYDRRARFHPSLPAPGAHWFFGMLPTYRRNNATIHDWWYECHVKQQWKTFQQPLAFLPSRCPSIFISDPRNLKHMLKDNFENYIKGPNFRGQFQDLLGHGIFNVNGDDWRSQRKIASHMFSLSRLRQDMSHVFEKNADILCQLMDGYIAQNTDFDIQDLFFRSTLDSFSEIAFGEHVGALAMKPNPFGVAFDLVQLHINGRNTINPVWKIMKLLNCGTEKQVAQGLNIINQYAKQMIAKRRHAPDCNTRGDLLSLFFQQKETTPEQLTDEYLRDVILNFMIAGRDTTAALMSWCMYEFTRNPAVEKKLVTEIDQAFEFKQPSYDATTLPYLQAFIYETLRLHPSVPWDGRAAVDADVLPDGTHIPPRTSVFFCPYSMGRSPLIWGPDPLVFRPERWLERSSFPTQYEFPHFFAGPRMCLGKEMAIMQASLMLSTLLLKFRVSLVPNQTITYLVTATMPIRDGLRLTATRRDC